MITFPKDSWGKRASSSVRKNHFLAIVPIERTILPKPTTLTPIISFSDFEFQGVNQNLHDSIVILSLLETTLFEKFWWTKEGWRIFFIC